MEACIIGTLNRRSTGYMNECCGCPSRKDHQSWNNFLMKTEWGFFVLPHPTHTNRIFDIEAKPTTNISLSHYYRERALKFLIWGRTCVKTNTSALFRHITELKLEFFFFFWCVLSIQPWNKYLLSQIFLSVKPFKIRLNLKLCLINISCETNSVYVKKKVVGSDDNKSVSLGPAM